jgi:hypothetical protein
MSEHISGENLGLMSSDVTRNPKFFNAFPTELVPENKSSALGPFLGAMPCFTREFGKHEFTEFVSLAGVNCSGGTYTLVNALD